MKPLHSSAPLRVETNLAQQGWLLVLGIILVAANQRAPITSVGPLIGDIRTYTGISNTVAGMLTTVPLLAFALMSPFAPKLARRYGMERVIFCALIVLLIGTLCRSIHGAGTLFAGTVLIGLAISICNVLIPSLVKRDFSHKVGLMTGVYSISMNLCGALASGISIPLARDAGFGWQGALICWGILVTLAMISWSPRLRASQSTTAAASVAINGAKPNLWRSGLAWQVTAFMGLQSLIFYMLAAWLPEILVSRGMSQDAGGWMLSLLQFSMLPFTLFVPIIAGRMRNQKPLVMLTTFLYLIGIGGLFMENTALVPLWAIIIGIAGAFSFSLAMIFFSLRTRTAQESAELSGMAQTVGYIMAAIGPMLFGGLHDITHGWNLPLMILIVASLCIFAFGLGAARDRFVHPTDSHSA
ncbi:CP family cyanate transporter-like MFS transporter [Paenibacillus phyllosphaerae]|uniref:CP family cyanate transporter-like MFS transporter n=1 Tax=Paenibacillus phyllosphaerae TaxID=274593 RepID=A0A7W5B0U7_9BACL|nr:MFS transporter [Paenibacillus phyllosphaerae]MBB3112380.1 CP family cyanate transporter-like MFS transporter [Paenibacillus phyllosphaerae]